MENLDEDALIFTIDAYIKGRLSETEMVDFSEKIAENPALAQQVARQRVHLEAIDILLEEGLRDKMNKWQLEEKNNHFNWKYWGFGVFALVILGSFYYFFKSKNNNETPIKSTINQPDNLLNNEKTDALKTKIDSPVIVPKVQQLQPIKPIKLKINAPNIDRNDSIVDIAKSDIIQPKELNDTLQNETLAEVNLDLLNKYNELLKANALRTGRDTPNLNLARTVAETKNLDSLDNQLKTQLIFFEAANYFLSKKYAEALPIFDKLAATNGFIYVERAEYYAAMCVYFQKRQKNEAVRRFKKIADDKEHEYAEQAQMMLKKLGY
jgi:hypothetical protein